jgi:hypothetical protein
MAGHKHTLGRNNTFGWHIFGGNTSGWNTVGWNTFGLHLFGWACVLQSSFAAVPMTVGDVNATGVVVATNQSSIMMPNFLLEISAATSHLVMSAEIAAMTVVTGKSFTSINGVTTLCTGDLVLINDTTVIPDWSTIPMVNCDDEDMAGQYLVQIENGNAPCTVMYSLLSQGCNFTSSSSTVETQLGTVFTMVSNSAARSIISQITRSADSLTAVIAPNSSAVATGSSQTKGKSSASTVAMAVLYSITGIIAAAFLFVIVSGAIRVHKHPERYGLVHSNYDPDLDTFGSSTGHYTNRAKGLARAVLDSIPLVKFQVSASGNKPDGDKEAGIEICDLTIIPFEDTTRNRTELDDLPIATLQGSDDDPMCPICFERFTDGDILRDLPCKHKFHALCVDPWLLNTSALCPLCRVDLSLASDEQVPEQPPNITQSNDEVVIPPGYDVDTSLFNRLLDVWNAQLLPREARRAALARFHEEAELRRTLRAQRDAGLAERNQRAWLKFVKSRRILHQLRRRTSQEGDGPPDQYDGAGRP